MGCQLRRLALYTIFLSLMACSGSMRPTYRIGLDPTFFPVDLMGKEPYVYGFIDDLLRRVGELESMNLIRVQANWDHLLEGLKDNEYDAVIANLLPGLPESRPYQFSQPFLATGPVLIMRQSESIHSFKDLNSYEIAVARYSSGQLVMEAQPQIFLRFYDSATDALADVSNGTFDGALVPYLFALSSIQDLYPGRLKIMTKPLTKEGFRLVSLKGEAKPLIERFNRGFAELEAQGEYEKLLAKWRLGFESKGKDLKRKRWWQRK